MTLTMAFGYVAKLPSISIRQASGVVVCGLNIHLWIFLGFLSSIMRLLNSSFAIFGCLTGGDFSCFTTDYHRLCL